jgi:hypothetical protein
MNGEVKEEGCWMRTIRCVFCHIPYISYSLFWFSHFNIFGIAERWIDLFQFHASWFSRQNMKLFRCDKIARLHVRWSGFFMHNEREYVLAVF